MNLGKKILGAFVEEVPGEESSDSTYYEESTEEVDISLDSVDTTSLISDIYTQNDVATDNGIFKVEELMNNLPNEMATEVKRKTVQGILTSFNVTVEDVVSDGDKRLDLLKAALGKIVSEGTSKVEDMQSEIEELKVKISELEKSISNEKVTIKSSNDIISSEFERISNLVGFIGGE